MNGKLKAIALVSGGFIAGCVVAIKIAISSEATNIANGKNHGCSDFCDLCPGCPH